jgi:hypothetical protein
MSPTFSHEAAQASQMAAQARQVPLCSGVPISMATPAARQ